MTVTLYDRHHVHLVLLAGLRDRPASGADLAVELARRSGGRIAPGTRKVFSELHHLARNALVVSDGPGRYRLTGAGERSLRHRERRWADYVAAVDGVRNGAGTTRRRPADPDRRGGHAAQSRAISSSSCS